MTLEERVSRLERQVGTAVTVDQRMDRLEQRLDRFERRMDRIEDRLGSLENRLDRVSLEVGLVLETLNEHTRLLVAIRTSLEPGGNGGKQK